MPTTYKATVRKAAAGRMGGVTTPRLLTRFGRQGLAVVTGGPAPAELMLACPGQEASSGRDLGNVNSTPHHPCTVDQGLHLLYLPSRPGAPQTVIWPFPLTPSPPAPDAARYTC